MGLGKTMQAITAVRLLLHAGEMRSVLLVCPKPLVTNWQREFALWAPELPLAVIEGDPQRRSWQWQLPDVPVKIANYEAAVPRSRAGGRARDLQFDLVVLDEAQRIKNRASATSQVRARDSAPAQLGPDRHAGRKQPDDLVGIFEFRRPGPAFAAHEAARAWARGRATTCCGAPRTRC